jgi:hypothetical protein
MMRLIHDTKIMKLYKSLSSDIELVKFITDNRSAVYDIVNMKTILSSVQSTNSLMVTIFNHLTEKMVDGKQIFAPINMVNAVTKPVSILTLPFYDPDLKAMKLSDHKVIDAIDSFGEYKDTILLNTTPFWNDKAKKVTDTNLVIHKIVRDVISRSYVDQIVNKADFWLSNEVLILIASMYAEVYGSYFGRIFNLNMIDQAEVTTIFGMYFLQGCTNRADSQLHRQLTTIVDLPTIVDMERLANDTIDGLPNSVDDIAKLITHLDAEVLHNFKVDMIFTFGRGLNTDVNVATTAIEYPPYWLYCLLSVASKDDHSRLFPTIQKNRKLNRLLQDFSKKLTKPYFDTVFD